MKKQLKPMNQNGVSLLELMMGMVVSGLVMWGGMHWLSSSQKTGVRTALKMKASSELQEFFSNRKKSVSKVAPSPNASAVIVAGATVTIPRTVYDDAGNANVNNEVIEIVCAGLSAGIALTDIPADYACPGVCAAGLVPVSVNIKQGVPLVQGESYPSNFNGSFPTGELGSQLAVSLCPTMTDNLLSLKMTYLFRPDKSNTLEPVSRTEVFEIPIDNGIPKPKVIGTSN